MKKINYLMSMFAIVLALGVMSCDPNEVTPDNTVDGIQLSDFDGMWNLESVAYNFVTYSDCTDNAYTNQLPSNATMIGLSFQINALENKVDFYDCNGTHLYNGFSKTVEFDVDKLILDVKGTSGVIASFMIVDYDLTTTPKIASIKLLSSKNSTDVVGATHNVRK